MLRIALALLIATPALAQTDNTSNRVQFIPMDELEVQAGKTRVPIAYMSARGRVKFERIVKLKHDVLPKMKRTAKDVALR